MQIICTLLGGAWYFVPNDTGAICGSIFISSSFIIASLKQNKSEK